jgi:hypothetical protein
MSSNFQPRAPNIPSYRCLKACIHCPLSGSKEPIVNILEWIVYWVSIRYQLCTLYTSNLDTFHESIQEYVFVLRSFFFQILIPFIGCVMWSLCCAMAVNYRTMASRFISSWDIIIIIIPMRWQIIISLSNPSSRKRPGGLLSLEKNWVSGTEIIVCGVERGRCLMLPTSPPSVNRLSRQCRIHNISQPCRPARPVTGIALLYYYCE